MLGFEDLLVAWRGVAVPRMGRLLLGAIFLLLLVSVLLVQTRSAGQGMPLLALFQVHTSHK
jgi:hypothetical protein